MGILLDDSLYVNSPKSAPLMRGDFLDLPESVSLKMYAPSPGSQGPSPTCVAWAAGYSGRTILEAMKNNWPKVKIDSNTFSPSYIYNQIRTTNDCSRGVSLLDALEILKQQGDVLFTDFKTDCSRQVSDADKLKAQQHRIIEYREIFNRWTKNKVPVTKKSLSEGKPVIIGLDCPESFKSADECWTPDSSDYRDLGRGHCVVVTGYDDTKFGGSFEILNSWGRNWANEGYTNIRYSDFDFFTKLGFEILDTTYHQGGNDLSGSLVLRQNNGRILPLKYNGTYFSTEKSYPAGTQFKLILSNNEPAFVYCFGSDLTFKCTPVFPFDENMSAYLPYKKNNVAIPGEDYSCELDNTEGTTYFCFLYSNKELDIATILDIVEKSEGTIWDRIITALQSDVINNFNIRFEHSDGISFVAKSKGKSIVPILIAIKHTKI